MATTIAEHYLDELADWNDSILFYKDEISDLELKLGEVISRNTIVGIAEKVEAQQDVLNQVSERFDHLLKQISVQEKGLVTDDTYVDDSMIQIPTEKKQNELRSNMQQAEKAYIDVKYNCLNFLSDTLKKKD